MYMYMYICILIIFIFYVYDMYMYIYVYWADPANRMGWRKKLRTNIGAVRPTKWN